MNLLRRVSPPNTYKLLSTRAAAEEALPAGGFNAYTVNHEVSVAETEQSSPKKNQETASSKSFRHLCEQFIKLQVILYGSVSLITQRPRPEMACIHCNGGVLKMQLFHFYSGI